MDWDHNFFSTLSKKFMQDIFIEQFKSLFGHLFQILGQGRAALGKTWIGMD